MMGLLVGILAGVLQLGSSSSLRVDLSGVTPFPFALEVDRLAAFFLLLICGVALPVIL